MAYKNKNVLKDVEQAKGRLAALTEIDRVQAQTVNYGGVAKVLTKTELDAQIKKVEADNALYNQTLDQADALNTKIERELATLREMSVGVLSAAKAIFGRDSTEVEQIGGTRLSERKRPRRRAAKPNGEES